MLWRMAVKFDGDCVKRDKLVKPQGIKLLSIYLRGLIVSKYARLMRHKSNVRRIVFGVLYPPHSNPTNRWAGVNLRWKRQYMWFTYPFLLMSHLRFRLLRALTPPHPVIMLCLFLELFSRCQKDIQTFFPKFKAVFRFSFDRQRRSESVERWGHNGSWSPSHHHNQTPICHQLETQPVIWITPGTTRNAQRWHTRAVAKYGDQ